MSNPILSVMLVSYNHEPYIERAIESILMQEVSFDFEVVVADDSSDDATRQIIERCSSRFPAEVRFLESDQNVGITRNYQRAFKACRGEYIAVIEGDDYWTSPHKLRRQVDFLHDHRECSFCFNRFLTSSEPAGRFVAQPFFEVSQAFALLTIDQLIRDNFVGNFSTCMYRRDVVSRFEEKLYDMKVYDWMFNIMNAREGMIGYLPDVMSVYRLHSAGTWSGKSLDEKLADTISLIDEYNQFLKFEFDADFQLHKNRIKEMLQPPSPVTDSIPATPESHSTPEGTKRLPIGTTLAEFTPKIVKLGIEYLLPPIALKLLRKIMRG